MTRHEAPSFSRRVPRRRIGQEGQILMMFLIFLVPMTMIVFSVYNVGTAVSEKIKVQTAADNAAYSAAVWEARYMNLTAYTNRAMIANYDALATVVALWSFADGLEGFLFAAEFVTQFIPVIGTAISKALEAIHKVVNAVLNDPLAQAVGSNEQGQHPAFGRYIEIYNDILSKVQPALYVLNQLGRPAVIRGIGSGVDRFVEYNAFAEILNTLSLDKRRKWDKTPANIGTGQNRDSALQLAVLRSLNNLADGGSLRDADLTLGVPLSIDFFFCDFGITQLGAHGFDSDDHFPFAGGDFEEVPGTKAGCGGDKDGDCKENVVRNDRIHMHDSFGLVIDFCVTDIDLSHHSDDEKNSLPFIHITDIDHTGSNYSSSHFENFRDNGLDCQPLTGGNIPGLGGLGGQGGADAQQASEKCGQIREENDKRRAQCLQQQFQNCQPLLDEETKFQGKTTDCDDIDDIIEDMADSFNNQLAGQGNGKGCAAEYKFSDNHHLDQVKVTTYVQDPKVVDGLRVEGPTVFVYFRKPAARLPIFRGLGLQGAERDFEAYSFAKVYYAQRLRDRNNGNAPAAQGRPQAGTNAQTNQESLFNPFWAARLERPSFPLIGEILH